MNFLKPKYEIGGRKYVVVKQIGEGAYAFVYRVKAFGFGDQPMHALKKLICQTEEQLDEAKKEMRLLSEISHPNVLHLIGSEMKENKKEQTEALLLMPLYDKTVQDIIDQGPEYPGGAFSSEPHRLLRICHAFCSGLQAIHDYGFRHCDFKPANVLIRRHSHPSGSGEEEVVITDLGSACPLTVQVTSRAEALAVQEEAAAVCTASYRAPELLDTPSQCTIDAKTDVWSVGCTLFNMLYSRTPFENPIEGFSVLAACAGNYRCPSDGPFSAQAVPGQGLGLSVVAVARACLLTSAAERPGLQQVMGMLECCQSLPIDASYVDPACTMFDAENRARLTPPNVALSVQSEAHRDRCSTNGSLDEFGDFEGAVVEPAAGVSATATPPPVATDVSTPEQCSVCTEPDRESIVSNPGVDPVPVKAPGGCVIFEGPIHVMRAKGGMNSKRINKMVWGVLTEEGILVRKTEDPASKVHAAMRFFSAINNSDGVAPGSPRNPVDSVEGLGPHVVFVSLTSSARTTAESSPVAVKRVASDSVAVGAAVDQGTPRRKSLFSFGGPSIEGEQIGRRHSNRRRSVSMLAASLGGAAYRGNPSEPHGNVVAIEFGVDSVAVLEQWRQAIGGVVDAMTSVSPS